LSRRTKAGLQIVVAGFLLQLLFGCSLAARSERMAVEEFTPERNYGQTIRIKVFGDNVGGFVSAGYPLPREDYEQALTKSLIDSDMFQEVLSAGDADILLTVGLIQLIQPQMSGNITLETTWSISGTAAKSVTATTAIRAEKLAEFSTKREATERAAQESIRLGMRWLDEVLP
jgi:hypothetical protein